MLSARFTVLQLPPPICVWGRFSHFTVNSHLCGWFRTFIFSSSCLYFSLLICIQHAMRLILFKPLGNPPVMVSDQKCALLSFYSRPTTTKWQKFLAASTSIGLSRGHFDKDDKIYIDLIKLMMVKLTSGACGWMQALFGVAHAQTVMTFCDTRIEKVEC